MYMRMRMYMHTQKESYLCIYGLYKLQLVHWHNYIIHVAQRKGSCLADHITTLSK